MKIRRNLFIGLFILAILVVFISAYMFSGTEVKNENIDFLVMLLFFVVAFASIVGIVMEARKHIVSFALMFWMFNFMFFGLAAVIQYISDWSAWGLYFRNEDIVYGLFLFLIWAFCFTFGNNLSLGFKIKLAGRRSYHTEETKSVVRSKTALLVQLLTVLYLVYTLRGSLFLRGLSSQYAIANSSLALINHHFFRNLIYYLTALQLKQYLMYRNNKQMLVLSLILFLIGCFPLAMSRYMIGAYYLGLVIMVMGDRENNGWFSMAFLFAIFIIFPISNMFRYSSSFYSFDAFIQNAKKLLENTYNTQNYDAFQMYMAEINYTESNGLAMGRQILGAMLFFVPRSLWPNKPVGSGSMIITNLTENIFNNVSMPLAGEFHLNFGVIGIVVFGILVGGLCKKYDRLYWSSTDSFSKIRLIYPSALMYFFFLNRGDMMSGGSYMLANIVMGLFARRLFVVDQEATGERTAAASSGRR